MKIKVMKKEDKDLLLKDLSARLPYGVICDIYNDTCTIKEKLLIGGLSHFCDDTIAVRPYLRPMSSMTEVEVIEFIKLTDSIIKFANKHYAVLSLQQIDWLNAHHFDYRGLIEKGLAIEVTKENNPYKAQKGD